MYNSWNSFLVKSKPTVQECTKLHDFAHKISKIFPAVIPPDPNVGGDDGSMHQCMGQSPSTGIFLATGLYNIGPLVPMEH